MRISVYDSLDLILRELGKRIQEYRVKMNMTQCDLATKSGVSLRTITAIENGKNSSVESLVRILKTLNLENSLNSIVPDTSEVVTVKQITPKKRYKAPKRVSTWKWEE